MAKASDEKSAVVPATTFLSDPDKYPVGPVCAATGDETDELATASLFGSGRRLVIVDEADDFVSEHRAELEDYVAKPHRSGVLVLDVKTWPSTTRLAKAVAACGLTIECKSLSEPQTKRWLIERAKS